MKDKNMNEKKRNEKKYEREKIWRSKQIMKANNIFKKFGTVADKFDIWPSQGPGTYLITSISDKLPVGILYSMVLTGLCQWRCWIVT